MIRSFLKCTALLSLCAALTIPAALAENDFSASGLTVSGSAQQLGKADSYGSGKVTLSVPDENPMQDGINPITGEPFSGAYRPILVTIDTHPGALPHWGVASADLLYEMPIQMDGSTRTLAMFMGDVPASAGPVRSARVPMCNLREMWGGTYCFYGYQGGRDKNNVQDWVKAHGENRKFSYPTYLNGMSKNSNWFPRSSDGGHVNPHNVRADLNAILSDYQLNPQPHPFQFTETGLDRGEDVNGLVISYKQTSPSYVTAYQYNDATGLYDRFRDGMPYVDGDTGEQCSFANVIVLRTDISWASNNPSRPVIRLYGEGVAEIFQNGKYIRGSWARKADADSNLNNRMVFFDENGQELPMKVGKTFVQIVDNLQPVVVLADEQIEGSVEPQEQRLTIGSGESKSEKKPRPKATRTPKPTATPEPTATPAPTEDPAKPVEPDQPEQPENPDQPEQPVEPETPEQPEPPVEPEKPETTSGEAASA